MSQRSDRMNKQAEKVTKVATEAQARSAKAEDLLMRLEDRDARRVARAERLLGAGGK
jgi:hypothetical protein